MKILITGSNGLLGQKLVKLLSQSSDIQLIATSKGKNRSTFTDGYEYLEMDITDGEQVAEIIEKTRPNAIIHTAAMTNVDTCEDEKDLAYQLNVTAVQTLVSLCQKHKIPLIHLSTDFIFDGKNGPYDELAEPNPLSYYGETKLAAEEIIKKANCNWTILRTIIVYGIVSDMSRSNIVLWAKGALEKGKPLNIVNDQWRMPTLAEDLADCCLLAVKHNAQGIFNASGKDMMSISELVARVADFWNLDKSLINEISAATLNQTAKRPAKTGFILDKAMTELNYKPHTFEEGLAILDRQLTLYI